MGKGRPFSASTQFKMIIHTNGNHRYASTKPYTIGEDGIKRYTYKHWGTLDEQNRFIPGMAYMYASIEEREQLIFPEIEYDRVDKVRGLQVTIVTTARTDEEGRKLLELMGLPFRKN